MKRFVVGGLAPLSLAFAATVAHAEAFVGTGVGDATNEIDNIAFDESATTFRVFGGYSFNDHFAIEAAWLDVGSMDSDASGVPVEVESEAIVVSALASLPLGERFSLFGKLGYAVHDTTAEARIGNQIVRDTEDDEDLLYGAGVNLDLGEHFALRLEYESVDVSAGSFDMASLSAIFRF